MSPVKMRKGLLLRLYQLLSHGFPLLARWVLSRRLRRGKEHPDRWREKLGITTAARPKGPLIWLHAVGLGEVLSLRGLIDRMARQRSDLSFLVTSTTAASAHVFARHLPARTMHQFLPLDAPTYRRRFLTRFRPDLCVWAEQDIWPGLVSDAAGRGIPQAFVAARMNDRSFARHKRFRSLYRDLYSAMRLITAQDSASACHIADLSQAPVRVTGSLKPATPPLECDDKELRALQTHLQGRTVWAVAPSHPEDEVIAIEAHRVLVETDPSAMLIIAPRFPDRRDSITAACAKRPPRKSEAALPGPDDPIWLCDTFGDLGLIYRLSRAVLIGGTFSAIEGHNPWEAAALETAIFHGPRTAHFANDFDQLAAADASRQIAEPAELAEVLKTTDLAAIGQNATRCKEESSAPVDALATDLIALLEGAHG